jgi:hypothetical protein
MSAKYEYASFCTREKPHMGPCNGFLVPSCVPYCAEELERLEAASALTAIAETKDSNPKDAIGVTKLAALSRATGSTIAYGSLAHL